MRARCRTTCAFMQAAVWCRCIGIHYQVGIYVTLEHSIRNDTSGAPTYVNTRSVVVGLTLLVAQCHNPESSRWSSKGVRAVGSKAIRTNLPYPAQMQRLMVYVLRWDGGREPGRWYRTFRITPWYSCTGPVSYTHLTLPTIYSV